RRQTQALISHDWCGSAMPLSKGISMRKLKWVISRDGLLQLSGKFQCKICGYLGKPTIGGLES
ncbi:MAG: hypothetical protein U9P00_09345, partial [Pseudomonadota bacterium]|nr:hypothetical protein [Pseudomonadota bacterium]